MALFALGLPALLVVATLLIRQHDEPAVLQTTSPTALASTLPPPVVIINESRPGTGLTPEPIVFLPLAFSHFMATACDGTPPRLAALTSDIPAAGMPIAGDTSAMDLAPLVQWHPITLSFDGPSASEADSNPNPFLDYRLQVQFIGPSGKVYDVPGYFAGDGRGGGIGAIWQARFSPDEAGHWRYCASFRAGPGVAVELAPESGEPVAFNGANGGFDVVERDPDAPGFLKWGRLEYIGGHYFKFRDGPYWLKGGVDGPENFLGYAGFDNTVDQGGALEGFLHLYAPHVVDWRPGDPNFTSADTPIDAKGIIGALNYLSEYHVNSIYFLPMNLGGDGQDTYPFITPGGMPDDNTHYDISKLYQWNIVLNHAQRQGIALHMVLNEVEPDNRYWLDNGTLGVERKLFYRELVARFGYLLAIKWNLSEEVAFSPVELQQFADYLTALDWAKHPIAIHNPAGSSLAYEAIRGDPRFHATAFQYDGDQAGALVEEWRANSDASGRPWVIEMDENNPAGIGLTPDNSGILRRQILYDVYFSGAGGIEWYLGAHDLPVGGDQNLEDFRTRERMWEATWHARRFMEDNLPFWEMEPADELLIDETAEYGGGEVFAQEGVIYAVYMPATSPGATLFIPSGEYSVRWYDPRTGEFSGDTARVIATSEGLALGEPPSQPGADWVILIKRLVNGRPDFREITPP